MLAEGGYGGTECEHEHAQSFRLKKGRRGVSIVVQCPICGREGYLRRSGIRISGTRYVVVHGRLKCQVSPTHPAQPAMDAIYRYVREGRGV